MTNTITIKGTREGLTITLGAGDLTVLLDDLARHLKAQGAFFRGGKVALHVGDLTMTPEDLSLFAELLGQHQMVLRTVVAVHEKTRQAADGLGLRVLSPEDLEPPTASRPQAPLISPSAARAADATKGMLIHQLVRSGQIIRGTGHVVVIGDVNPGGEIVAGGDVVIWGRLRGIVHAGAMGNEGAMVCALDLSPMQLRIGEYVARPADDEKRKSACPEVATVRDGIIVVEPWDRVSRGR